MRRLAITLAAATAIALAGHAQEPAPTPSEGDRARWTLGDMRTLATAIEAYAVDHKAYPKVGSLEEVVPLIQPVYIRHAPVRDAWGNPFVYSSSADGKTYRLVSPGSDHAADPSTWDVPGELSSYAADAVLDSGQFRRGWMYR